ncbi:MAG TPA: CPBP family intramembrane glutamic endopeptidase [Pseudacidobacterium sp.]|jgi:hypothetical protein|nr:CPBP family intramembrane glutamic endopeptidase [Pseudacidobacterium sp.]
MTLDPISLTPVGPNEPSQAQEETLAPEPPHSEWPEKPVDDLPHFSHAVLFFLLSIPALFIGESVCLLIAKQFPSLRGKSYRAIFDLMNSDARLAIPTQAFVYLLIGFTAIVVFTVLWQRTFSEGIHWNIEVARNKFLRLGALGLGVGVGIGILQSYLPIPMPQNPPILQDMIRSPLGAWMMLIFGITFAPLIEELAFRGFLLPGLIHAFRWLMRHEILSTEAFSWMTVPLSVLLTTVPFVLLHAEQVSRAWGPLLLIGLVSVILCVIRLRLNSVAASTVVHAAYNFTLFAGMLVQTEGFRHLERLNG